jgi:Protein of unknown function (DUF2892)
MCRTEHARDVGGVVTWRRSNSKREAVMKRNVGGLDRVFRFVIGIAVLALGLYFRSWWGALGLIPIATAVLSWCPVYLPFGTSTRTLEPGARA